MNSMIELGETSLLMVGLYGRKWSKQRQRKYYVQNISYL